MVIIIIKVAIKVDSFSNCNRPKWINDIKCHDDEGDNDEEI